MCARKPLAGTVAANVLAHGTGALNIDGCRVGTGEDRSCRRPLGARDWCRRITGRAIRQTHRERAHEGGRWPPNILLTHSASCQPAGVREIKSSVCGPGSAPANAGDTYGALSDEPAGRRGYGLEVMQAWDCAPDCPAGELDRQSGTWKTNPPGSRGATRNDVLGTFGALEKSAMPQHGDTGGASRFFPSLNWDAEHDAPFMYCAKAPASERPRLPDGTAWPTVKPVSPAPLADPACDDARRDGPGSVRRNRHDGAGGGPRRLPGHPHRTRPGRPGTHPGPPVQGHPARTVRLSTTPHHPGP